MDISPEDSASNSGPSQIGNDQFEQFIAECMNENAAIDTSGTSPSNALVPSASPPASRRRRAANAPIPVNADVIDLDSLSESTLSKPKPIIKSEDEDIVFIKSEPGLNPAKGAIKWPNTKDCPIILDDDEPPPTPKLRQCANEHDKKSASPRLEDVPMADLPGEDTIAPSEGSGALRSTPVEDTLSPDEIASGHRSGEEIDMEPTTSSQNAILLNEAPAAGLNASIGNLDLDTSASTPKGGPARKGGIMSAGMRDKLRIIQQKAQKSIAAKRNQSSGDGASSAPSGPVGSSAPSLPAASANSSAPRTPPVPSLPEISAPGARPLVRSVTSTAHIEHQLSLEDGMADNEMRDAEMQDSIERDFPDEYLDEVQKFKAVKKKYEKRRAAGKTDLQKDIQIMQQQSNLDNWRKRLMDDRQHDNHPEEDSLFAHGGPDGDGFHGTHGNYGDGMNDYNDIHNGPGQLLEAEMLAPGGGGPKRSPSKRDKNTKERRGKPAKGRTSNDKIKDKNAKITKGTAAKGKDSGKGGPSGPRNKGPSMLDYESLFTGDVIRAAQANQGRAQLPAMASARRHEALKALVASVPQEHRKMAQMDRNYLDSACKDFAGRMSVRAHPGNDGWEVLGMTCILKHHQLLGAAFMRRRERSNETPRGGICADQMGLGKTIMALANIVNGQPPRNSKGPRTTLIVATPALITQWMSEINKHTLQERKSNWRPLKVLKWHGKSKPCTNDRLGGIPEYDIVLTTYDEVRKSYPKEDYPIHLQTRQEREAWWQVFYQKNKGVLHEVEYWRVVLDEAQAIKNHKSHTSIACRGLIATHRWALSGTPIQNAPRELFPYFKFLRVEHTGTYKIFCQNFIGTHSDGSMSKVGLDRLHSFLSRFMIRRTHADQLMGAPIVSLPKASERIYWCQFNDLERAIYEMVRARMIQRINRLSRSRQLENSYSNILTMLLRLRQLTGHLLALEQPMKDLLEREDHEKIYDLAKEANTNHRSGHKDKMRGLREELDRPGDEHDKGKGSVGMPGIRNEENENEKDKDNDRADSIHGSAAGKDYSNTGRHHGSKFDFLMYLQDLKDGIAGRNSDQRSACAFCNDIAEEPWKTQCYHVYCRRCLERMAEEAALRDQGGARCVVCHIVYTGAAPCDKMNFDHNSGEYDDDSNVDDESDQELLRKTTKQGRKKNTAAEKSKDWIDLAEDNDILPSSKTLAIKAQIINWLEEDPDMKIIIYTQFIDMIRVLSKVCNAEKWKHSLYHGGKSYEARDEAIREFSENPDMRIMIASLRCGGVGLNLTMAQKVIVVDPWWNSSVEQQAFCRVFRIGQKSETSMTRFVVGKTVDENMIRMQERKQKEIDIVMDNDKHCKLTIPELLRLFGEIEEDEDGQPFLLVENRETLPNPNDDQEDEGYDDD